MAALAGHRHSWRRTRRRANNVWRTWAEASPAAARPAGRRPDDAAAIRRATAGGSVATAGCSRRRRATPGPAAGAGLGHDSLHAGAQLLGGDRLLELRHTEHAEPLAGLRGECAAGQEDQPLGLAGS